MLYKTGNIYWADMSEETDPSKRQRPVVILKMIDNYNVEVIPLSSNTTNIKNRLAINLLMNDNVSYVSLMVDAITVIPTKNLKHQMGFVDDNVIPVLNSIVNSEKTIKSNNIHPDTKKNENNSYLNIGQENMEAMKPYVKKLSDTVSKMDKKVDYLSSKKLLVINMIIAVFTGIVASLITNYIWVYILN